MKSKSEKSVGKSVFEEATEKKPELEAIENEEVKDARKFEFVLVVKSPFKSYSKGDQIVDPNEIQRIMQCKDCHMVVKRATKREIN